MWNSINDWQQRLTGSYILLDGEPFYISNVRLNRDTSTVRLADLRIFGRSLEERYIDDEDCSSIDPSKNELIDLTYNPRGYANVSSCAMYIMRKPSRYYKYCVTRRTLLPSSRSNNTLEEALLYLHNNKYPSFEECFSAIESGMWERYAFSKDFAITHTKKLMYRGFEAGRFKSNGLTLSTNYKHLTEKIGDINVSVR